MSEKDLQVHSAEYVRTGFSRRPGLLSGRSDRFRWAHHSCSRLLLSRRQRMGLYETPGAFEAMQHGACTRLMGVHLVKDAGHSVVEEQVKQVNRLLKDFLHQAQT